MEFEDLDTFFGFVDGEASRSVPKRLHFAPVLVPALTIFILGSLRGDSVVAGGYFLAIVSVAVLLARACTFFTSDSELTQDPVCIRRIHLFLAQYIPFSEEAFEELRQRVNREGRFSYEMLERWYRREKFAVLHPERRSRPLNLRQAARTLHFQLTQFIT